MSKHEYNPIGRTEIFKRVRSHTPVEATCAVTTNDSQILISSRRYGGANGLIVPLVKITGDYDRFEEQILTSGRLGHILDIHPDELEKNAEVTFLGETRLTPAPHSKLMVPCAVEIDLSSAEVPVSSGAHYTWRDIGETEDTLAKLPAPIHLPKIYDSHFALQSYINTMTYIRT